MATFAVILALIVGLVGIGYVVWKIKDVLDKDQGNETMRNIASAIQEGAAAFLNREYTYLAGFVVIVAAVIAIFLDWQTAVCFVSGALASADTSAAPKTRSGRW